MASYNKLLDKIVKDVFEKHASTGHWPKVQFSKTNGFTSFSLFEYGSAQQPYYYAVHRYIIDVLDNGNGIYTKKRNAAFVEQIRALVDQPLLTVADLKIGDRLKLAALRQISKEYREGSISGISMLKSDNIIDLTDCVEKYGYQDTYGSCYSNEVLLVLRDNFWRRFEGIGEQATTYPSWAGG